MTFLSREVPVLSPVADLGKAFDQVLTTASETPVLGPIVRPLAPVTDIPGQIVLKALVAGIPIIASGS